MRECKKLLEYAKEEGEKQHKMFQWQCMGVYKKIRQVSMRIALTTHMQMTLSGSFLGGKTSSQQDLMNIVKSPALFITLLHQRDCTGQIMWAGSIVLELYPRCYGE